jgi:hypothetical protein
LLLLVLLLVLLLYCFCCCLCFLLYRQRVASRHRKTTQMAHHPAKQSHQGRAFKISSSSSNISLCAIDKIPQQNRNSTGATG